MSESPTIAEREYYEISAIYEIRRIIEPEPGRLMLSELVEAVRAMQAENARLRKQSLRLIPVVSLVIHHEGMGLLPDDLEDAANEYMEADAAQAAREGK
jgi:hypothetical protein